MKKLGTEIVRKNRVVLCSKCYGFTAELMGGRWEIRGADFQGSFSIDEIGVLRELLREICKENQRLSEVK